VQAPFKECMLRD